MTTANEEFSDLMPHQIEISGSGGTDDYGQPIEGANKRVYRCLIDDTTTETRTADGTTVTVALTAYVAPVPIGEIGPVDIKETESAIILSPDESKGPKTINSIERHYDSDMGIGMLHNLVVRFS